MTRGGFSGFIVKQPNPVSVVAMPEEPGHRLPSLCIYTRPKSGPDSWGPAPGPAAILLDDDRLHLELSLGGGDDQLARVFQDLYILRGNHGHSGWLGRAGACPGREHRALADG